MKKLFIIFVILFVQVQAFSQKDTSQYDRLEEIINNNKRYRIHNNYLSFGFGYLASSLRDREQAVIGIDFNFHIKRNYFQAGVLMSGNEFLSNNSIQAHICYGYRKETEKYNFAAYAGPSFNTGVIPPKFTVTDTIPPRLFDAYGIYLNVQYVRKLTYDIGIGVEAVFEYNKVQTYGGIKCIFFFSGSYKGKAKVYNKHVKSYK